MRTFILSIEMGNDAMDLRSDVGEALIHVGTKLQDDLLVGNTGVIADRNGNIVGQWKVENK